MKTLKEVCAESGVSRRAVQGYEKAGLVRSSARNKYGHLLYDESEQEQIKLIKTLQDLGLSIKEIAELLKGPASAWRPVLEEQISKLEASIEHDRMLIRTAKELIARKGEVRK